MRQGLVNRTKDYYDITNELIGLMQEDGAQMAELAAGAELIGQAACAILLADAISNTSCSKEIEEIAQAISSQQFS